MLSCNGNIMQSNYISILVAKPTLQDRKACRNAPCMFGHLHMFGCHSECLDTYLWLDAPICLDTTHMFQCPCMLDTPICLDAPCLFGHLHMFGCPHYVWTPPCMFGYPTLLDNTCICLDAPCMFGYPHMFGCLPVCLDTSISLYAPNMLDVPCTYTTQRKHALSD